jgi:hypothetical protein
VATGLILVMLSLYVFDWLVIKSSGRGLPLHELDTVRRGSDDWDLFGGLAPAYIDFLGLLLLLGTAASALMATWPSPAGLRRTPARVLAVVVLLIAVGVHWLAFVSVVNTFSSNFSMAAGNWAGLLGYVCVLIGVLVGPARVRQPA